jgi:hypothetical protein
MLFKNVKEWTDISEILLGKISVLSLTELPHYILYEYWPEASVAYYRCRHNLSIGLCRVELEVAMLYSCT